MRKLRYGLGAAALGLAGFVLGLWVQGGTSHLVDLGSSAFAAVTRTASETTMRVAKEDDPIVFWRDPMGNPVVSAEPKKDSMGMDYVPVRRSEVAPLFPKIGQDGQTPADERPLFYRDPMGGTDTSPVPRKDGMGMDYLPVYPSQVAPVLPPLGARSEAAPAPETPAASAAGGGRRILYYRNPMGLPDTSPVPKKDSMGMDYTPVYADETADDGSIGISPARLQTMGVRTAPASRQVMTRSIRAIGTIATDERRSAMVTPRVEGWIEHLYVNETGRGVAEGEPLMEVYSPDLLRAQSDYLLAVTSGRSGDLEGGRFRLVNLGLSDPQIDRIRASGRILRTIQIPAPIGGTVLSKTAIEGMMFRPGDPLFRIADLSTVVVLIDVFEQDVGLLRQGLPVSVTIAAYPGETFQGSVDRIYPALETATRTAKVRITLPNPDGRLRIGMLATAEVAAPTSGGNEVVSVPAAAVVDSGERRTVFVETGAGRFKPVEVRTGARADGRVEILSGLSGTETVVDGATFLIDAESNMRAAIAAFAAEPGQEASR